MSNGWRLMAVHAHPDDESSKGAASTAKYANDGVDVMVVSCTGGERGDILNPKLKDNADIARDLSEVRRREMAKAAQILGIKHTWLGFVDSGLPEGDPLPPLPEGCFALEPIEVTTEALVRVIRDFKPHVITTYDENGGYPHPDHIMTHVVTMAAFRAAGDPDAFPHAGEAWQPQKVYYSGFSPNRMLKLHQAMLDRGMESPFGDWIKRMEGRPERAIHTHVECGDFFEARDDALRAHATQVDPDGFFFAIPMDLQREVAPTEDYELAVSLVPVELPESDLFAGLIDSGDIDAICQASVPRDEEGNPVAAYTAPVPPPASVEPVDEESTDDDLRHREGHSDGEHDESEEQVAS